MDCRPTVSILTYCAHPAVAYGTLLIFKTLRVGFPTARIEVFDNASHADVCTQIKAAAAACDASFTALPARSHAAHLRWLLEEREPPEGPLVIVDPDVIFWRSLEQWDFGAALMAGRLMPAMGKRELVSVPRLHPSLLWVPTVARLREAMATHRTQWADMERSWDGVAPHLARVGDRLFFFDTMARAHAALERRCHAFDAGELDAYDHLFFGSHLPTMDARLGPEFEAIVAAHRHAAAGDLQQLRGIWRRQAAFFEDGVTSARPGTSSIEDEMLQSVSRIQEWQGLQFDAAPLASAMSDMTSRVRGQTEIAR